MATPRRKLLVSLGILGGLLLLGVGAVLLLVRPADLLEKVLARARATTGYEIEAEGASVRLGRQGLGIRVNGIEAAAPESLQVFGAGNLDLYLRLRPLLRREIAIQHLEVSGGRYEKRTETGVFRLSDLQASGTLDADATTGVGTTRGSGRAGKASFSGPLGEIPLPPVDATWTVGLKGPDRVSIDSLKVGTGAFLARFQGGYARSGETWTGRLEGDMDPVSISEIVALLPESRQAEIRRAGLSGTLASPHLVVITEEPPRAMPIEGQFLLEDLAGTWPGREIKIRGGSGRVDLESAGIVRFDLAAEVGETPVRLSGTAEPFLQNRGFRMSVKGNLTGPLVQALMPPRPGTSITSGLAEFDLSVAGTQPVSADRLPRVDGRVEWSAFEGTVLEKPLHEASGRILLKGGGARVEQVALRLGGSDLRLTGSVASLAEPELVFDLTSNRINLGELFPETSSPGSAVRGGRDPAAPSATTPSPDGEVIPVIPLRGNLHIRELLYRDVPLRDVEAGVVLAETRVGADLKSATLAGGNLAGSVTAVPAGGDRWDVDGRFQAANVQLAEFLSRIPALRRRAEGVAETGVTLKGIYSPGAPPLAGLTIDGNFKVSNGAVLNVAALEKLGSTFNIREVTPDRWPFRNLASRFSIQKGRVVMDTLEVNQNGAQWGLAGSIGLDGTLDSRGVVRLDPKIVSLPGELQLVADSIVLADGRVPIDFRLGGTLSRPEVQLDLEGLARRAAERAVRDQEEKLRRKVEDQLKDPDNVDKLKKLIGGGKKKN